MLDTSVSYKRRFLIKILINVKRPPVGAFLHLAKLNKVKKGFIKEQFKASQLKKDIIVGRLKGFLIEAPTLYRDLAAELLKGFDDKIVVNHLEDLIPCNNKIILINVLEIFSDLDHQNVKIATGVKKIIKNEDEMWLRYYALKAYINTAVRDREFYRYIGELQNDKQELVRLEARSI
jgi:hypothetical protein